MMNNYLDFEDFYVVIFYKLRCFLSYLSLYERVSWVSSKIECVICVEWVSNFGSKGFIQECGYAVYMLVHESTC